MSAEQLARQALKKAEDALKRTLQPASSVDWDDITGKPSTFTPATHALGGSAHNADTLANLNSKITNATLDDASSPRTPTAHASSHENGGSDEISVAGLSGELADAQTPKTHAASHSDGGADEVTVENLATASTDTSLVLKPDGSGGLAFGAGGGGGTNGWELVGSNTTEQTTTSTSDVDLVTIGSLNIPATQPIKILVSARKTDGAANAAYIGLKLNSTIIIDPPSNAGALIAFSGVNRAESGYMEITVYPRRANYVAGLSRTAVVFSADGGIAVSGTVSPGALANPLPTDPITSISIRAQSGSGSVTVAVQDVYVYALATS